MRRMTRLVPVIMPVNKAVGVERLFDTCRRYFAKTGRRISYEYAMIDGVNDSDWQADLLAKHLKGTPGHVNLIPLNEVKESLLKPSRRVEVFQKRLEHYGIAVTVRRKLGGDIDASCGQLRREGHAGGLIEHCRPIAAGRQCGNWPQRRGNRHDKSMGYHRSWCR